MFIWQDFIETQKSQIKVRDFGEHKVAQDFSLIFTILGHEIQNTFQWVYPVDIT